MTLQPAARSVWRPAAPPSLSTTQKFWLFRPGALTAGLRQLGHVDLTVLAEYVAALDSQEAWMLGRRPHEPVWLREILMSIDGVDSVYARSFTPLKASHSLWQGMRRLRTRPLADMLYHDPQIARSRFYTCRVQSGNPIYKSMQASLGKDAVSDGSTRLHARCSVFWRCGEPLLVAECFLPAFWDLAGTRRP